MMRQEVLNRAAVLAGQLDAQQQAKLEILCTAAVSVLEQQLREGVTPEDCREAFVTAACLQVMAAMEDCTDVSEFRAGDLTVKQNRQGSSSQEFRDQARALMAPYLKDRFRFAGV